MTSVEACEPELPPLEMIRGTNSASTTARAISSSKNPIAVAVSISPRNRTTSQPARFLIIRVGENGHVGLAERLAAAEPLQVARRHLLRRVQDVVHGDDADQDAVRRR